MTIYKKLMIRLGILSALALSLTVTAPSARASDPACISACTAAARLCSAACRRGLPGTDEGCLEDCAVNLTDCESGC
jgi:hypothetical protein